MSVEFLHRRKKTKKQRNNPSASLLPSVGHAKSGPLPSHPTALCPTKDSQYFLGVCSQKARRTSGAEGAPRKSTDKMRLEIVIVRVSRRRTANYQQRSVALSCSLVAWIGVVAARTACGSDGALRVSCRGLPLSLSPPLLTRRSTVRPLYALAILTGVPC